MIAHRCTLRMIGCILALTIAGCGGNPDLKEGAQKYKVSGTVTLDGKPLENGSVTFDPKDGSGTPAFGGIEDGKFNCEVAAGTWIARFAAGTRDTGEKDEYGEPITESIVLPEKYTSKSEVEVVIKAEENVLPEFKLTSK